MIEIVHALRKARGSNAKREILALQDNNPDWQRALLFMYDESINYYMSSVPDNTFIDEVPEDNYEDMFLGLELLQNREDFTAKYRKDFAIQMSQVYGEIFRLIIGRSLKAKVATGLINGAYPGLIPVWDIMKGKDIPIPRFTCMWSIKYDGIRLTIRVEGLTADPRTSSGKHLQLDSLIHQMLQMPEGVYEGELVWGEGKQADRPKITSLTNKILLGSATDGEGWHLHLFDFVTLKEWDNRKSITQYSARLSELQNACGGLPNVHAIYVGWFNQPHEVDTMFGSLLAVDYEGLMVRYPEDVYEWGRVDTLIKKKAIKEATVTCVGTTAGTGKYGGLVGALQYSGTVEGVYVEGKVGSGLSEFDVNRDPADYIGKEIEVLYNYATLAVGADHHSLFLVRYKRIVGEV